MRPRRPSRACILLALLFLAGLLRHEARAQEVTAPAIEVRAPVRDVLPSPPEYFLALSKDLKPRWRTLYQPTPTLSRPDRPLLAMLMGTLLADSYAAVEARDGQRVRNICQDLRSTFLSLGLAEDAEENLQLLVGLAEREEWNAIRYELERGHYRLAEKLLSMHDHDLAVLVELGLWLRTLEMGSRLVQEVGEPARDGVHSIGSIALMETLQQRAASLQTSTRELDYVQDLEEELERLARRWKEADGEGTLEDVEATTTKLHNYLKRSFEKS